MAYGHDLHVQNNHIQDLSIKTQDLWKLVIMHAFTSNRIIKRDGNKS